MTANTSATLFSQEPWSRRCSVESVLSIQGKETDFVCDSSDADTTDGQDLEYEPCTEPEDEPPSLGDSSGESADEIISTKVIAVSVRDDGDLEFADSEQTDTDGLDSEVDLCDYWRCVQCRASNNNPMYRYCERCFKVRKNFFPPRPKRKNKRKLKERKNSRPFTPDSGDDSHDNNSLLTVSSKKVELSQEIGNSSQEIGISSQEKDRLPPLSQESGFNQDIGNSSQEKDLLPPSSQDSGFHSQDFFDTQKSSGSSQQTAGVSDISLSRNTLKRRAQSAERRVKRTRTDVSSDSDSDCETKAVSPLIKTISDPSLTVEDIKITKKVLSETAKEIDKDNNMCIVCLSEPKSGVFVHGRIAHICCCYKCAIKVWAKAKRCPVCNCKVSNVLKAVVM